MHPPRLLQSFLPLGAAGFIACATAGCAAQPTRAEMIHRYTWTYIYHHPPEQMAAAVRHVLEDRGFEVAPLMQGEVIKTEWKQVFGSERMATVNECYYVQVHPITKEHSRVTAVQLQQSTLGMETYHPIVPFNKGSDGPTVTTAEMGEGWKPLPLGKPLKKRAFDLEWELIRRLDPNRARQIEATVDYRLAHGAGGS